MKYIAIYHANLNYSGLEEERYEFVIRNSYEKIIDIYNDPLKGVPYCFEASGYTIDKINEICPDVMEKLKDAAKRNCEVLASPYPHLMLPNFPYQDGLKSLEFTMETYQRIFGFTPESGWNPECGWRQDVPQMFKAAGFKNLIIDWEASLISGNEEIKQFERSNGPYGHHLPYYPVSPAEKSLHFPIKIMDGLTGIFRSDRVSNRFLFYLMAAMSENPLYQQVSEAERNDHQSVTLEQIIDNVNYWSGDKDGILITYADDAEYIGTSGYFLVKYYNKNEYFLENPSHGRLLQIIQGIKNLSDGFITVKDAVRQYPTITDQKVYIEDDMAWHRSKASSWAKTPTSLEWDPICKDLSRRLSEIEARRVDKEMPKLRKAWFALTCAENSDGRWPPPPQKPGEFNINYCMHYLEEAKKLTKELEEDTEVKS